MQKPKMSYTAQKGCMKLNDFKRKREFYCAVCEGVLDIDEDYATIGRCVNAECPEFNVQKSCRG